MAGKKSKSRPTEPNDLENLGQMATQIIKDLRDRIMTHPLAATSKKEFEDALLHNQQEAEKRTDIIDPEKKVVFAKYSEVHLYCERGRYKKNLPRPECVACKQIKLPPGCDEIGILIKPQMYLQSKVGDNDECVEIKCQGVLALKTLGMRVNGTSFTGEQSVDFSAHVMKQAESMIRAERRDMPEWMLEDLKHSRRRYDTFRVELEIQEDDGRETKFQKGRLVLKEAFKFRRRAMDMIEASKDVQIMKSVEEKCAAAPGQELGSDLIKDFRNAVERSKVWILELERDKTIFTMPPVTSRWTSFSGTRH